MKKRLALCVGINDYPETQNDLRGCINDAEGWTQLMQSEGYEVVTLLDGEATRENVLSELRAAMHDLRFGERFVFTYSGHGSWVPDRDGDEVDGRDECIVLHDWEERGFLTDDEMYNIWQTRVYGVRVSVFSDSCFSGTVARFLNPFPGYQKPRFFDPDLLTPGASSRAGLPRNERSRPGTLLLSGCDELEVSYDADIAGMPQGAMSWAALTTYRPGIHMKDWHKAIRTKLPSDVYPQSPQLQSTYSQRYWTL